MRLQRAALAKQVQEYGQAVATARRKTSGSSQRLAAWSKDGPAPKDAASPGDLHERAVALQRREIERLQAERSQYVVRAPFEGRVGQVLAQEGMMSADPASPMVTVVKERPEVAIAYLSESDARRILVGDAVRLIARDAKTPTLTGRVTALAPSITEVPIRFRHFPHLPEFVRNAYIALEAPAELSGQAFDAIFDHHQGGGT
jgi:multidrug resistance efflux pump